MAPARPLSLHSSKLLAPADAAIEEPFAMRKLTAANGRFGS
jgi:hypothetical protein